VKQRIKINGLIIAIAVLLVAIFPRVFISLVRPGYLCAAGVACIIFGQLLRVSARGYKAEYSKQGQALIQGGPYSLVRNPMYLGILLIGLGIVLVLFKWWVACVFIFVFILRYIPLIFQEEEKLRAVFPEEYASYKKQVPRILPSLKIISQADIRKYLPLKSQWLKKELGSMVSVLLVVFLIKLWSGLR
jgi:protein-S-isoprenylcysteine O-methyltransferase Ste14